jgi:hypothetical protein
VNRRFFAESLALAALAPALGVPAEAVRLDFGRLGAVASLPTHSSDSAAALESGSAASLMLALVEIIRLEYGSRLTAEELAGVAEQIQAGLDRADLIRQADRSHAV